MTRMAPGTAWEAGRLDAGRGPPRVLFGRMYEDSAIERAAFKPGGRVFCIASAGCTAMSLAPYHEVVAVDINPAQLAYAARRIAGAPMVRGTAEHVMRVGRALLPLAGWNASTLRAFLDLDDPAAQRDFWKSAPRHAALSRRPRYADVGHGAARGLRTAPARVAPRALRCGDARADGALLRHSSRTGRIPGRVRCSPASCASESPPPEAKAIKLVHSDAAAFLERAPPAKLRRLHALQHPRWRETTPTASGSSARFPVPRRRARWSC